MPVMSDLKQIIAFAPAGCILSPVRPSVGTGPAGRENVFLFTRVLAGTLVNASPRPSVPSILSAT